jgi:phosphoglycolate phosphatase
MIKGIMFDMDNTLLKSNIDFKLMKSDLFDFLVRHHILTIDFAIDKHTTSTLIEYVRTLGITTELYESIMDRTAKHELIGMHEAGLEQGAKQLLELLYNKYTLVVITNNSFVAASEALTSTGIAHFFDLIIGREMMTALKPSPSGFHYVMDQFPGIKLHEWVTIGDSWIDGKAAQDAGVPFISYRADANKLSDRGIEPIERMDDLMQLYAYVDTNLNL